MSNESTTPGPAQQPRPSLPQFDPSAQATQAVPTAPSTTYAYAGMPAPEGNAPIAGSSVPLAATGLPQRTGSGGAWAQRLGALFAGKPAAGDRGGPADAAGRWTAKKTAVTAGLAIVLASAGAIGAAAAMPAGSTGGDSFRGPGGRSFQFPGGGNGQGGFGRQNQQLPNQQGQNGQQLPNLQGQNGVPGGVPGGGLSGIDPNQLSQLDPQDLLQQLGQGVDPFSGGSGSGSAAGARTT